MVPGGSEESFFDYKFSKENYKILHSFHKKKILNSFSGTFFNRHRIEYESGLSGLSEFSNVYFFLPAKLQAGWRKLTDTWGQLI